MSGRGQCLVVRSGVDVVGELRRRGALAPVDRRLVVAVDAGDLGAVGRRRSRRSGSFSPCSTATPSGLPTATIVVESAGEADEGRVEVVEVGAQHRRGVARPGRWSRRPRRPASRSASSSRVIAEARLAITAGRCRGSWCSRRRPGSAACRCPSASEYGSPSVSVERRARRPSNGGSSRVPCERRRRCASAPPHAAEQAGRGAARRRAAASTPLGLPTPDPAARSSVSARQRAQPGGRGRRGGRAARGRTRSRRSRRRRTTRPRRPGRRC